MREFSMKGSWGKKEILSRYSQREPSWPRPSLALLAFIPLGAQIPLSFFLLDKASDFWTPVFSLSLL
jgi:hypothetical protein